MCKSRFEIKNTRHSLCGRPGHAPSAVGRHFGYNAAGDWVMTSAQKVLAAASGLVCALAVAPPILASLALVRAGTTFHLLFSPLCHQLPARCFVILGRPIAVCHRCAGIYLGIFLGSLVRNEFMHSSAKIRRLFLMAASVPLLLDFLLQFAGIWQGSALSRFGTGLVFGMVAAWLLLRSLTELLHASLKGDPL